MRCARDTMPPLRRVIVGDVARHPRSATRDVVKRLQLPRQTVDRALQELQLLRLLAVEDEPAPTERDPDRVRWVYSLAPDIDAAVVRQTTALRGVAENSPGTSEGGAGQPEREPGREAEPEREPELELPDDLDDDPHDDPASNFAAANECQHPGCTRQGRWYGEQCWCRTHRPHSARNTKRK
jgi:hypothetical protein